MHELFKRQLAEATRAAGKVDIAKLGRLISASYAESERALARMTDELDRQRGQMRDFFEMVPEGLALFDRNDCYVMWNRRYAEMYAKSSDTIAVGARFEDTLRAGLARGQYRDAVGREEAWLAERLSRHRQEQNTQEQHLPDGRWVRVEERRTSDGGSIGVRIDITDLKEREASFRLMFESNPLPMWVWDHETLRYVSVNDAAVEHYGYPREQFEGKSLLDLRPHELWDDIRAVASKNDVNVRTDRIWRHIKADGTLIDVAIYARPLNYNGRPSSLVVAIDVTERKRSEEELRRTREFVNTILENVPATVVVKDARDLRYVLINRAGEAYFGVSREQMIGKTAHEVFPTPTAETITAHDRHLLATRDELFVAAHTIDTPGNGKRVITTKRVPILDTNGEPQYLLGVIEDVTERKEAEARIAHLAHHDPLTDLPNRAFFGERLAAALEHAQSTAGTVAVICIDLDRFKEVNDVFGHSTGDALLRALSTRLCTAAEGAFLARVGGDEFTLIATEGLQPASAETLAKRLLACVAADIDIDGHLLRVGLSIGVAVYPADGSDASALLRNADAALYRAKSEGRGAIRFFEADMDKRLRERRSLQQDLRSALDRGELALHFQPQSRIDGDVIGFEALARWHHPRLGPIAPGSFIPLAEESGIIIQMSDWILREACREAASWPRPLQIAVNLSPTQFQHGDLPRLVHAALLETGLAPGRLELEITEGVLIGDFSRAVSILRRVKALGVLIALDDFGTGYSSLSYLQSFPFDKIKIDRAFVANVVNNPQSAAIIRAVIGLAHGLNAPVVAEGVETQEQCDFLTRENCDILQGYLLGRPGPIADFLTTVGRAWAGEGDTAEPSGRRRLDARARYAR